MHAVMFSEQRIYAPPLSLFKTLARPRIPSPRIAQSGHYFVTGSGRCDVR